VNPNEEAEIKAALQQIKEATGISELKDILNKMERHQATISQLQEMQKSLQHKYLQHMGKRDNLQK